MYKVSEEYKVASLKSSRETKVEGYIKLSNKLTISFNSSNILAGSLSIDNSAVNGQELNLGTVYTGKMQITLKLSLDRYQLYDKEIGLSYFLKVGDNWEEVPLGVFYINEAQRNGKYIAISAYDKMLDFDKDFSEITTGRPFSLISQCCEKCGMEMEQTEEEIDALSPTILVEEDGEEVEQIIKYGLPSDSTISTHRALLSELATIMGGFFIIGRTGKLKFMKFGAETGVVITDNIRKNAEIYDYKCEYSGVKATIDDGSYISGTSDKIVIDIGNLGLFKNGLIETKTKTVDFIYEQIKDLKYTPGSVSYVGDPALDLGDMVMIKGYDTDEDGNKMCITSYNWNFHGNHKLQAVGKNIKIADSKKQTSQQIKVVAENVKQASFNKIVTFYNAEKFEVGATPYKIARLIVPVSEKTSILATGQIVMNVKTPGTIKIKYKLNEVEEKYSPMQIVPIEGYYMINLLYVLKNIDEFSQNIFEVFIESQDAAAEVDIEHCIINLSGSAIVDADVWDGTLSLKDTFTAVYLGNLNQGVKYIDTMKNTLHKRIGPDFVENYKQLVLGSKQQFTEKEMKIDLCDKTPQTFTERHRRLHFCFGGLSLIDKMEINIEEADK